MLLKNDRGSFYIIAIIVIILALFGGDYLYRGFRENRLKDSVMEAVNGYREIIENTIDDPQDKQKADEYMQNIRDLIEKNHRPGAMVNPDNYRENSR